MDFTQALNSSDEEDSRVTKQVGFLVCKGVRYPVNFGSNIIGRDEKSEICMPYGSLSRQHAVIKIEEDSSLPQIMDLRSINKTKVGSKTLSPYDFHPLKHGDAITLGDIVAIFEILETQEVPDTPAPSKLTRKIIVPESPDADSSRDESFINPSQQPVKNVKRIPLTRPLTDSVFWNATTDSPSLKLHLDSSESSKRSEVIAEKDNSNDSIELAMIESCDIYEATTQIDTSVHEAKTHVETSVRGCLSIHEATTQLGLSVHDATTQPGFSVQDIRKVQIHEAETQPPAALQEKPLNEDSDEDIIFEEFESQQVENPMYKESQNLLEDIQVTESKIPKLAPVKEADDDLTDCEDDLIELSQNIERVNPVKATVDDDDDTDCEEAEDNFNKENEIEPDLTQIIIKPKLKDNKSAKKEPEKRLVEEELDVPTQIIKRQPNEVSKSNNAYNTTQDLIKDLETQEDEHMEKINDVPMLTKASKAVDKSKNAYDSTEDLVENLGSPNDKHTAKVTDVRTLPKESDAPYESTQDLLNDLDSQNDDDLTQIIRRSPPRPTITALFKKPTPMATKKKPALKTTLDEIEFDIPSPVKPVTKKPYYDTAEAIMNDLLTQQISANDSEVESQDKDLASLSSVIAKPGATRDSLVSLKARSTSNISDDDLVPSSQESEDTLPLEHFPHITKGQAPLREKTPPDSESSLAEIFSPVKNKKAKPSILDMELPNSEEIEHATSSPRKKIIVLSSSDSETEAESEDTSTPIVYHKKSVRRPVINISPVRQSLRSKIPSLKLRDRSNENTETKSKRTMRTARNIQRSERNTEIKKDTMPVTRTSSPKITETTQPKSKSRKIASPVISERQTSPTEDTKTKERIKNTREDTSPVARKKRQNFSPKITGAKQPRSKSKNIASPVIAKRQISPRYITATKEITKNTSESKKSSSPGAKLRISKRRNSQLQPTEIKETVTRIKRQNSSPKITEIKQPKSKKDTLPVVSKCQISPHSSTPTKERSKNTSESKKSSSPEAKLRISKRRNSQLQPTEIKETVTRTKRQNSSPKITEIKQPKLKKDTLPVVSKCQISPHCITPTKERSKNTSESKKTSWPKTISDISSPEMRKMKNVTVSITGVGKRRTTHSRTERGGGDGGTSRKSRGKRLSSRSDSSADEAVSRPKRPKREVAASAGKRSGSVSYGGGSDSHSASDTSPIKRSDSSRSRSPVAEVTKNLRSSYVGEGKCSVMFTGLKDPKLEKIVDNLGGTVVSDPVTCTVLVTERVKRTLKFLLVLGLRKPIVGFNWLYSSQSAKMLLDPWHYILVDPEFEKKHSFTLKRTLKSPSNFLNKVTLTATPSVQPPPEEVKLIVEYSGGTYINLEAATKKSQGAKTSKKSSDILLCLSCKEDVESWPNITRFGYKIVSMDTILTGMLRNKLEWQKFAFKTY